MILPLLLQCLLSLPEIALGWVFQTHVHFEDPRREFQIQHRQKQRTPGIAKKKKKDWAALLLDEIPSRQTVVECPSCASQGPRHGCDEDGVPALRKMHCGTGEQARTSITGVLGA